MRKESHSLSKNSLPAIQAHIHHIMSFIQESYDYTDIIKNPYYTDEQFLTLQTRVSTSMGILGPLFANYLLHCYKECHPKTTLHCLPITEEHMIILRDAVFQLLSTSISHISKLNDDTIFDITSALYIASIYWCMKKLARYPQITTAVLTMQMRQDIMCRLERLRNLLIILNMTCDPKNSKECAMLIWIKDTQKTLHKARSIAEQFISTRALSDKSNTSDDTQSHTSHIKK